MPTVLEILKTTTAWFEKRGVESPRLNAEHLAAHALGRKKRLDLYMEFDRPLGDAELEPLRQLVRRRAEGVPLQHLLGTVEFFGREFLSDARALVPRPETEQLVEIVLESDLKDRKAEILDVGTGSGVIAVTLALELPEARVTAVDLSADALALAAANAEKLGAAVTFHNADLLPSEPSLLDAIIANLPYIPTAEIATLSREVRHDPVAALDGGTDGLELVRRLVAGGFARLSAGGAMHLEVGHDQAAAVVAMFEENGYRDARVSKDYQGVARFVTATRPPAA